MASSGGRLPWRGRTASQTKTRKAWHRWVSTHLLRLRLACLGRQPSNNHRPTNAWSRGELGRTRSSLGTFGHLLPPARHLRVNWPACVSLYRPRERTWLARPPCVWSTDWRPLFCDVTCRLRGFAAGLPSGSIGADAREADRAWKDQALARGRKRKVSKGAED